MLNRDHRYSRLPLGCVPSRSLWSFGGRFAAICDGVYLVDHGILFQTLHDKGLPCYVTHLLSNWYTSQKLSVRWNTGRSSAFFVSNGVKQGGELSPVLFTVYIDSLLQDLKFLGAGCYWDKHYAGAYAYADDVVLLAPASALR